MLLALWTLQSSTSTLTMLRALCMCATLRLNGAPPSTRTALSIWSVTDVTVTMKLMNLCSHSHSCTKSLRRHHQVHLIYILTVNYYIKTIYFQLWTSMLTNSFKKELSRLMKLRMSRINMTKSAKMHTKVPNRRPTLSTRIGWTALGPVSSRARIRWKWTRPVSRRTLWCILARGSLVHHQMLLSLLSTKVHYEIDEYIRLVFKDLLFLQVLNVSWEPVWRW